MKLEFRCRKTRELIWLSSPKHVSGKVERPTYHALPWQCLFSTIIPTAIHVCENGCCYLSKKDNHHAPVLLSLQHLV